MNLISSIKIFRNSQKTKRKLAKEVKLILASGLFDADWYSIRYPDSLEVHGGPVLHYLKFGAKERRSAGPKFDTNAYLNANPDVAESGHNPLIHFILHGRKEGRTFSDCSPQNATGLSFREHNLKPVTFSFIMYVEEVRELETTVCQLLSLSSDQCELILGTFAEEGERSIQEVLRNSPIPFKILKKKSGGIFLEEAIKASTKQYVILVDVGVSVHTDALEILSRFINNNKCDIVYSDESHFVKGSAVKSLVLKPSWSPELLTSCNYFGRLTAIRRSVAARSLPTSANIAAAEWELNLSASSKTRKIERIPKVLCSRNSNVPLHRCSSETFFSSHSLVLENYWQRRGRDAKVSQKMDGSFVSTWAIAVQPLVSIIIPTKERADLLRKCLDSIYKHTSYKNFEIIIVDNDSIERDTLDLYVELSETSAKIIPFAEEFNYSRACNLGASKSNGDFLLFLNNDIEICQEDWLYEMVRQALEPGIGVVGSRLVYPDGEIQHAGVVLGLFTLAAHIFHRATKEDWGIFGSPNVPRNYLAVTGACQLVRRHLFELVGGYNEAFQISYSDVVLCLEISRMGFRTVYLGSVTLIHHEGATRGSENPAVDQVLFAHHVRKLGISADPYFHPNLDTASFVPRFRNGELQRGPTALQRDIELLAGQPKRPVDLYDDGAVATAAGVAWNAVNWDQDPASMEAEAAAGARIILQFIRRRSDLRRRFPKALQDGVEGGFAFWVKTEGLQQLGLARDFASSIDAAFAAKIGSVAYQFIVTDEKFRHDNPLFFLPTGRPQTCSLLFNAAYEGRLTLESAWWHLLENAEDSQAALCKTWEITPGWQTMFPDGGTVFGVTALATWVARNHGEQDTGLFKQTYPKIMSDVAQVRLAYASRQDWQVLFPTAMTDHGEALEFLRYLTKRASGLSVLPRVWAAERFGAEMARKLTNGGVNVLAHFSYPSGLRISAESIVEGIRENGFDTSLRDVPVSLATDDAVGQQFKGLEVYDTTIIHVQPEPFFGRVYEQAGLAPRTKRTYRIGYWYWEFSEIPSSWNWAALQCDEIWTASKFIADGLSLHYRQPIKVLVPGIEIAPFRVEPRQAFGLDEEDFIFLFVFHMTSVMDRKNPLGLIRAFKQAFSREKRAKLVIKVTFGERHPESLASLEEAAYGLNVKIIDQIFNRNQTLSLISACDAYVSLHRSEGLGLTMAEAMLLGRPVIATGYSGNLEFMNDENSLLVDHKLVELKHDIAPYQAGQCWAEPSIEHAADLMRKLYDDPRYACRMGANGAAYAKTHLNYEITGKAIKRRLLEVSEMD